jgi:guanylate kinase
LNDAASKRQPGLLMVVSAPSGTGKTSICREILRMFPNVRFSVSCTTRPPRPGEVDGKDYHFIPEEVFRQQIARGEFVEWELHAAQLGIAFSDLTNRHLDLSAIAILPPTLNEPPTLTDVGMLRLVGRFPTRPSPPSP